MVVLGEPEMKGICTTCTKLSDVLSELQTAALLCLPPPLSISTSHEIVLFPYSFRRICTISWRLKFCTSSTGINPKCPLISLLAPFSTKNQICSISSLSTAACKAVPLNAFTRHGLEAGFIGWGTAYDNDVNPDGFELISYPWSSRTW